MKINLPKWATTVTPLSKTLAFVLFISFPIIGFFIGLKYQSPSCSPSVSNEVTTAAALKKEVVETNCLGLKMLDKMITNNDFSQIDLLAKSRVEKCPYDTSFYNFTFCDNVPDNTEVTTYGVALSGSEGGVWQLPGYKKALTDFVRENGPFEYVGNYTNEKSEIKHLWLSQAKDKDTIPNMIETSFDENGQVFLIIGGYIEPKNQVLKPSSCLISPSIQTNNWNSYNNTKYGFSFQYPTNFEIDKYYLPNAEDKPVVALTEKTDDNNKHIAFVVGHSIAVSMNGDLKECATDEECFQSEYSKFPSSYKVVDLTLQGKKIKGFEHNSNNQLSRIFPMSVDGKYFVFSINYVGYTQAEIDNKQELVNKIAQTLTISK